MVGKNERNDTPQKTVRRSIMFGDSGEPLLDPAKGATFEPG